MNELPIADSHRVAAVLPDHAIVVTMRTEILPFDRRVEDGGQEFAIPGVGGGKSRSIAEAQTIDRFPLEAAGEKLGHCEIESVGVATRLLDRTGSALVHREKITEGLSWIQLDIVQQGAEIDRSRTGTAGELRQTDQAETDDKDNDGSQSDHATKTEYRMWRCLSRRAFANPLILV